MWVCHNINLGTDYTDFFALLNNSSRINLCKHALKTVLIRVIRALKEVDAYFDTPTLFQHAAPLEILRR